jgi:threonine/homoserine/homoserine lactone efflux protein
MREAIGQVLSLGVGVALSPVPIIAVVLMLATPRARSNGPAFVLGWVLGLGLLGTIVLLVSSGADANAADGPATWVSVLELLLGLLLVAVAVKEWRDRPRGDAEPKLPTWMRKIDRFTPGRALGVAVAFAAVNPKNALLAIGAATAIAGTGASTGAQAVALAVFVVIATLGVGTPVAIYFALGERSHELLDELKTWMGRHNNAIMAVLCLVIGAKLLGDGIASL